MKTVVQIKKAILTNTGRVNVADTLAMPLFCLQSQAIPQKGIYFRAPAGAGKTGTVRRASDAAEIPFYSVSASCLSISALIDGESENGGQWPGLAKICSLESASPALIYLDEFHTASEKLEQWILSALDPEQPEKGAEGAWILSRSKFLICVGTNEGIGNPALSGPSGRFIDLPLAPLTPAQVEEKAVQCAKEKAISLSPSAVAMVKFYSPATFRGVENVIFRLFSMLAGEKSTATGADVAKACQACNVQPDGLSEVQAGILRLMAGETGAIRQGTIKGAVAAQLSNKVWLSDWNAARSMGFIADVAGGFTLSADGRAYVKGLTERKAAILAMDDAPAPAKKKAPAPAKGKGKAKK